MTKGFFLNLVKSPVNNTPPHSNNCKGLAARKYRILYNKPFKSNSKSGLSCTDKISFCSIILFPPSSTITQRYLAYYTQTRGAYNNLIHWSSLPAAVPYTSPATRHLHQAAARFLDQPAWVLCNQEFLPHLLQYRLG